MDADVLKKEIVSRLKKQDEKSIRALRGKDYAAALEAQAVKTELTSILNFVESRRGRD